MAKVLNAADIIIKIKLKYTLERTLVIYRRIMKDFTSEEDYKSSKSQLELFIKIEQAAFQSLITEIKNRALFNFLRVIDNRGYQKLSDPNEKISVLFIFEKEGLKLSFIPS